MNTTIIFNKTEGELLTAKLAEDDPSLLVDTVAELVLRVEVLDGVGRLLAVRLLPVGLVRKTRTCLSLKSLMKP